MRMIFKFAKGDIMKTDYETKQKTAIVDFIKTKVGHITAKDIVNELSQRGEKVSTATVYRRLEKLVDSGMLKKYITDSGACYQYNDTCSGNHFHLKCTGCGTLLHIDCEFLMSIAPHIMEHHKFKVDNRRTVMYGLCENCNEGGAANE